MVVATMDKLCNWCFSSVAPEPWLPEAPKEKDGKTKIRESMIARLHSDGTPLGDKSADLDEIIQSRTCNDIDVDELCNITQNGVDLDELIEAARALVSRNLRIMKRCESNRWGGSQGFTFQRIDIPLVNVVCNEDGTKTLVSFRTTPRRQTKNFGFPSKIPSDLSDIIVEKKGFAGLPDYELFLERSLLLHNDVLKPFLLVLKGHLESIQSFYHEIETWIQVPELDRDFLEQTFGIFFDVSLGEAKDEDKEDENTFPSTVQRSDSSTCTSLLDEAKEEAIIFQDREDSGDDDFEAKDGDKTDENVDDPPEAPDADSERSAGNKPAVLQGKPDLAAYSNTKTTIADVELILKEYMADGSYELEFQIDQIGHKEKLVKFIAFLEG